MDSDTLIRSPSLNQFNFTAELKRRNLIACAKLGNQAHRKIARRVGFHRRISETAGVQEQENAGGNSSNAPYCLWFAVLQDQQIF
jgi:hypothetical protein